MPFSSTYKHDCWTNFVYLEIPNLPCVHEQQQQQQQPAALDPIVRTISHPSHNPEVACAAHTFMSARLCT